ncbi:hypothetical protein GCM10027344_28600 [Spelaeicoccus albus]
MIVECRQCADGTCAADGGCLVAAFAALEPNRLEQPERPEWILEAPEAFDAREIEALAVLSDAGLVPALVPPLAPVMPASGATTGPEPDDVFWPADTAYRDVG